MSYEKPFGDVWYNKALESNSECFVHKYVQLIYFSLLMLQKLDQMVTLI